MNGSLSLILLTFCLLCIYPKTITSQPHSQNKANIIQLASGYILSRAIYVAAKIKVADFLVDTSCHITDLADKTNTNQDALHRLLRLLASYDIFYEDQYNNFSLTPLAKQLVSTNEHSLWAWITYHHEPNRWNAYGDIESTIKTGIPAFNQLTGHDYFDFISASPQLSQEFDEGMKNISADENALIVQSYDFSCYPVIVDIAGGTGGLLSEILTTYPSTHAILFDLPHVETSAHSFLTQNNKNSTFSPSQGFFNPIPQGAHLYILKRVLHDWNDENSITILKNCADAMPDDSKIIIIEALVAEENIRDLAKDVDIEMMVLFGGKERTKKEWIHLLNKAHLELIAIHKTPSMLSIIEVQKKGIL